MYLQKVVSKPTNLFCTFCHSIRHEEKDYRAYDFIQERMMDTYYIEGIRALIGMKTSTTVSPQFAKLQP